MKVKLLSDWLLVKCDPFQSKSTVIELVTNESSVRTGVLLDVGPGKIKKPGKDVRIPMDVVKGERVAFLRWHQEHRPGKAVVHALAELSEELAAEVCLIRVNDILFAFDGEVRVDLP